MSYPTEQYGEYSGIGKKLKKLKKRVVKVARKVVVAKAGIVTGGLIKPKILGIKSKGAVKLYRKTGKIAKIGAAVAGAVVFGPALLAAVGPTLASAGSASLGALKFVGGKLVSAPKAVLSALTRKGIDPKTTTPDQAVQAGLETGAVTPSMIETLMGAYMGTQGQPAYPGGAEYPARETDEGQTASASELSEAPSNIPSWVLPVGVGVAAFAFMKGRK